MTTRTAGTENCTALATVLRSPAISAADYRGANQDASHFDATR